MEATRIGPAPTAEGPGEGPALEEGGEGLGVGSEAELPAETGATRGRTGERPVFRGRTGPPTSETPQPGPTTGNRPALVPDRGGRTTTGNRPALPAEPRQPATFADALVQDNKTSRAATVTATLVMPKVEVPEPGVTQRGKTATDLPAQRGGKGPASSDSSLAAQSGRTVSSMDTPIGRGGGTRITRMPEAPGGKERAEAGEEAPPAKGEGTLPGRGEGRIGKGRGGRTLTPRQENDGFGTVPTTANRPALGNGQVRGPVLPVKELVPRGLEKLAGQEEVAKKFASDVALLHQQVRPSELPPGERALRAWAFFTAYAEAAAAHESTPQGKETFDKALKDQWFAELRDARSGEEMLKKAQWVLEAPTPQEARERAEDVLPELPPEVLISESALLQQKDDPRKPPQAESQRPQAQEQKENAFTQANERAPLERVEGQAELVRVSPPQADGPRPVMVPVNSERRADEEPSPLRQEGTSKKLGGNMVWNILHRFRASPEDSAIEKEKWNQLAFGAVLALVAMMLVGILLVSL